MRATVFLEIDFEVDSESLQFGYNWETDWMDDLLQSLPDDVWHKQVLRSLDINKTSATQTWLSANRQRPE